MDITMQKFQMLGKDSLSPLTQFSEYMYSSEVFRNDYLCLFHNAKADKEKSQNT